MKYFVCLAVLTACAYAQVSISKQDGHPRHPRDVKDLTWDKQIGENGKIFGSLGHDPAGLFGKAGYNHQIFNDDRGKLNAQAYGSRVLGPYGDSTNFGGKLDWADKNAKAAIDLSKSVGGHTGVKATGEGVWNLDKTSRVSAGGLFTQDQIGHGRPDYGVQAEYKKDF